jgi:preprotein translocase subunit SecG
VIAARGAVCPPNSRRHGIAAVTLQRGRGCALAEVRRTIVNELILGFSTSLLLHLVESRESDLEAGWARTEYFAMTILIVIVHVIVCFFLIAVVLLQSGKSGDLAAAFGGQGSQTAFGPRGAASVLSRATTWSAIIFMVTSITLSIFAARRSGPSSVLSNVKPASTNSQPVTPAPAAPPTVPQNQAPQK